MKNITTQQICEKHKLKYQTAQSRIRVLKLKPAEVIGGTRLWSAEQVRRIVKAK